jgi:hypothetical protein
MFSLMQVGHCSFASLSQPGVSQVVPASPLSGFILDGSLNHSESDDLGVRKNFEIFFGKKPKINYLVTCKGLLNTVRL